MRWRRLLGNPSADLTLKGYEYAPENRRNKAGSLRQRLNVRRGVHLALLIHCFNGSINFLVCNLRLLMDLMSLRWVYLRLINWELCSGGDPPWPSQVLVFTRAWKQKTREEKCFYFPRSWIIECKCALGTGWYSNIIALLVQQKSCPCVLEHTLIYWKLLDIFFSGISTFLFCFSHQTIMWTQ